MKGINFTESLDESDECVYFGFYVEMMWEGELFKGFFHARDHAEIGNYFGNNRIETLRG